MNSMPRFPTHQLFKYDTLSVCKHWLVSQDDLNSMYKSIQKGVYFCGVMGDHASCSHKRAKWELQDDTSQQSSMSHVSEVDDIVADLNKRHGTTYSLPKLRLWVHVITTGNWDD